jgi:hypothetical protein
MCEIFEKYCKSKCFVKLLASYIMMTSCFQLVNNNSVAKIVLRETGYCLFIFILGEFLRRVCILAASDW